MELYLLMGKQVLEKHLLLPEEEIDMSIEV
jgi:hypothetical protein